jgi:sirohydrochlorin ferrochelatase
MTAALIVSHGQPSDPGPAEAALAALAARVEAVLPGWRVGSATLAAEGALGRALGGLGAQGVAFPLFMAGGWFTRVHLPGRLAAAGGAGWRVLEPLGCEVALHDLALRILCEARSGEVLLAAHGSGRSIAPAAIAGHVAARIAAELGVRAEAAFIDQAPKLSGVRGFGPGAVCLPFFAAEGEHVSEDLPAALAEAGFPGRILPAIGLHPEIPGLIAAALLRGQTVCAGTCRWQAAG